MTIGIFSLFLMFFKIGLFTFGGGYAMLPLIQQEVASRGLMSMEELTNFVAVSESTPGPFAINIATYVGMHSAKICGMESMSLLYSAMATLGVVMPSFIVILIVAHFYEKFKQSHTVKGVMSGLRPAVVGLLAAAVVSMGKTVLFHVEEGLGKAVELTESLKFVPAQLIVSVCIFALMAFLGIKKKLNPILLIVLSAALGIGVMYALEGLGIL